MILDANNKIDFNTKTNAYRLINRLVKVELRSKIIVDTMNLKHVALLNLLHYIAGILQYHSTSSNYVRVWVIKCTGYDRPVFIDSSHHVCDRH